jgi:hypothetical protein
LKLAKRIDHQQLHAGWSGNSTSSARHAQYFSA